MSKIYEPSNETVQFKGVIPAGYIRRRNVHPRGTEMTNPTKPKRRLVSINLPDDLADWFDEQVKARRLSRNATGIALLEEARHPAVEAVVADDEAPDPTEQPQHRRKTVWHEATQMGCARCNDRKIVPHETERSYVPCPACQVED